MRGPLGRKRNADEPVDHSFEFSWLHTVLGAVLLSTGIVYVTLGALGGRVGTPVLGFGVLVAAAGVMFLRIGRGASVKWPATILGVILLIASVVWVALGMKDGFRLGIVVRGGIFTVLAIVLLRHGRGARSITFRPTRGRRSEFT
jgi:hypothetical protein